MNRLPELDHISNILDKPVLSAINFNNKQISLLIIPGSNKNSDLTITVPLFKNRLKNLLLSHQRLGDINEWSNINWFFFFKKSQQPCQLSLCHYPTWPRKKIDWYYYCTLNSNFELYSLSQRPSTCPIPNPALLYPTLCYGLCPMPIPLHHPSVSGSQAQVLPRFSGNQVS